MHGDQTMGQFTGHIQSLKIMVKYKTLVRLLTGGVCLQKVGKKFGTLDQWLLMRGGHTRRFKHNLLQKLPTILSHVSPTCQG